MIPDATYLARRLHLLGEWDAALAALGPEVDPELRAEIAVDRWFFRIEGHEEAEKAVAALDPASPTAHLLTARLAYSRLLFRRAPRADDRAVAEAGYRAAVASGDEKQRAWAEYHWAVLLDNIDEDPAGALPRYEAALEIATKSGDGYFESYIIRVSAGMDLALALVAEALGERGPLAVARHLVVYPQRQGGQSQFSVPLSQPPASRRDIDDLRMFIVDHQDGDLSGAVLAARMCLSERHFARVFRQEIAITAGAYVEAARVEAARRLLEGTDQPLDQVAAACGQRSVETLHRALRKQIGTTPAACRRRFRMTV